MRHVVSLTFQLLLFVLRQLIGKNKELSRRKERESCFRSLSPFIRMYVRMCVCVCVEKNVRGIQAIDTPISLYFFYGRKLYSNMNTEKTWVISVYEYFFQTF